MRSLNPEFWPSWITVTLAIACAILIAPYGPATWVIIWKLTH